MSLTNYIILKNVKKEINKRKIDGNELYLNSNYTFDNFVVGDCNKKAYLHSAAIATTLEGVSGPLILFGSVAVGKTHLLHAVANYIIKKTPHKHVVYSNGEIFTNDVQKTLHRTKSDQDAYQQFEKKYKRADVLVVEDIDNIFDECESRKMFWNYFMN